MLVGGGHAHIEVLRRFATPRARRARGTWQVTLITPRSTHLYSSSLPAVLRGEITERAARFDLAALAERAGVRLVCASVTEIEAGLTSRVRADGIWYDAHALSLDVGSMPTPVDAPDGAQHVLHVRSPAAWSAALDRTRALFAQTAHASVHAVVVGAGAGGVEIALALAARRDAELGDRRDALTITLIDARDALAFDAATNARLRTLLARQSVRCVFGRGVRAVRAHEVELDDESRLASTCTWWLAGAAAPTLLSDSQLPCDADGFLLVDDTLRAVDGVAVWGAGDCITISQRSISKAGVYAVREAPILAHNLLAYMRDVGARGGSRVYVPQREFLSILDTSDGRALLRWRGHAMHSRWALWIKRAIDARFVARYRVTLTWWQRRAWTFGIGAIAIVLVHQPLVTLSAMFAHTPWLAYSWRATSPLGVPATLSSMWWGGVWMMSLAPFAMSRDAHDAERIHVWRTALLTGFAPTMFGALLQGLGISFTEPLTHPVLAAIAAVAINISWGAASALVLAKVLAWQATRQRR